MSTAPPKIEAKAAKGDSDSGGKVNPVTMDGEAYADALLKQYRQGLADAAKFRADYQVPTDNPPPGPVKPGFGGKAEGDGESEGDAAPKKGDADAGADGGFKNQPGNPGGGFAPMTAKASKDQVGRTNKSAEKDAVRDDLISRVRNPTLYAFERDPAMKEIFTAAITHKDAPSELRGKFQAKGEFKGNQGGAP
jgi:hypothetical protein